MNYNKYKLVDVWYVELSKHPFQKNQLNNSENFYIFEQEAI